MLPPELRNGLYSCVARTGQAAELCYGAHEANCIRSDPAHVAELIRTRRPLRDRRLGRAIRRAQRLCSAAKKRALVRI